MKEWWMHLSIREKQTVFLGAVVILILSIYSLCWSPLKTKVSTMREQIQRNEQLLAWMQVADKQIQSLGQNSQKTSSLSSASLLSVTQNLINESPIASELTQLRQADTDSVQLSFKEVDFDKLILWLSQSSKATGLVASQFTVTRSSAPGTVSAELILKSL